MANMSGLYLVNNPANINTNFNLSGALQHILDNANDGDTYYIVLGTDETIPPMSFKYSNENVKITILGDGQQRTINLASNGSMFTIGKGVTLTLGENIKLQGHNENNKPLIEIHPCSTLIMNDGAMICGNNNGSFNGGGVSIKGGDFIMYGGTISGNAADYGGGIYIENGSFTMHGGIICKNISTTCGGGIYVHAGIVTMHNGTICENNATTHGGGVHVYAGDFLKTPIGSGQNSGDICNNNTAGRSGEDVYRESAPILYRNTNVGQTEKIDTRTGKGLSANGSAPFI